MESYTTNNDNTGIIALVVLLFFIILFIMAVIVPLVVMVIHARNKRPPSPVGLEESPDTTDRHSLAEAHVTIALHELQGEHHYTVFDNLTLTLPNGYSAHVDHLIVSRSGIFCVTIKPHRGYIYGNSGERWVQYIGEDKFWLRNPLKQNDVYRKAIQELLGTALRAPIHNYAIFPNATAVKTPHQLHELVTNDADEVVSRLLRHTRPVYDLTAYERILKRLVYASDTSGILKHEHRRQANAHLQPVAPEVKHY